MNSTDRILENIQKEVELYGRSGSDSIYLDNYQFTIPADQFDLPSGVSEDECVNDVAWFFTCSRKRVVVPHPNPDRSFWIKRFGKDALPYGTTWNIKKLVDTLKDSGKQRQAILSNGLFSSTPPCILLYQFQQLDYGSLDLTVFLRSSDVCNVLSQDVFMSRVILEQVAQMANLSPGKMTFMIGNAHVFYRDSIYQEEFTIDYGN
jgi:hypothetical protein